MQLEALLVLIPLLGSIWVFLLSYIRSEANRDPAERTLFFLSFAHCLSFIYLVLSLVVLFGKTCQGLSPTLAESTVPGEVMLVATWPAALLALGLGYVSLKLTPRWMEIGVLWIYVIAMPALVIVSLRAFGAIVSSALLTEWAAYQYVLVWGGSVLVFMVYVLVMSMVLADAAVTTDRAAYRRGEEVSCIVRPGGYVLLPDITGIGLNAIGPEASRVPFLMSRKLTIPDVGICGMDHIVVEYRSQVIPFVRTKYFPINIFP